MSLSPKKLAEDRRASATGPLERVRELTQTLCFAARKRAATRTEPDGCLQLNGKKEQAARGYNVAALEHCIRLRSSRCNVNKQTRMANGNCRGATTLTTVYHGPAGGVAEHWSDLKETLMGAGLAPQAQHTRRMQMR